MDNGILLCRWHRTFLHSKRWQVRLDASQQPIFTKPDGTLYSPQSSRPRHQETVAILRVHAARSLLARPPVGDGYAGRR